MKKENIIYIFALIFSILAIYHIWNFHIKEHFYLSEIYPSNIDMNNLGIECNPNSYTVSNDDIVTGTPNLY